LPGRSKRCPASFAAAASFLGQSTRRAADYFPQTDGAALSQTHAETASLADTAGSLVHIAGAVLPFGPGHAVDLEGQQGLIHTVSITGHPNVTTASQTFQMQPGSRPLPTHRPPPSWPARSVWAFVTDNEDKDKQGRIQVEFEFEPLDPQPSGERVWLHTLTPYGGGQDAAHARLPAMPHAARAHSYTGFLSLPEVGERVLVQFHAHWDNDAVVLGSVRHGPLSPAGSARDAKRWRTPSGNEVALTTEGEGAAAKDVVSLHARNHVVLEAHVSEGSEDVFLLCGSSYVHLTSKNGQAHVEVTSAGTLLLHADGHLQIEGQSVQIKAPVSPMSEKIQDKVRGGARSKPVKAKPRKPPIRAVARPAGHYHSVIATRKGGPHLFAAYQGADGKVQEVRTGGTAAWRYNNPGNMNPGSIADGAGAIGKAWVEPHHHGNTAVFPDEATGYGGARALLRSSLYNTKRMEQTVHKWVGIDLGQLPQYVHTVQEHSLVQPTDIVGKLSDDQLDKLAHAMSVAEGWREGTTFTPANVASAPQWVKDLLDKGKAP
jgi:hypothetical protein